MKKALALAAASVLTLTAATCAHAQYQQPYTQPAKATNPGSDTNASEGMFGLGLRISWSPLSTLMTEDILGTLAADALIKYWVTDRFAVIPGFGLTLEKDKGGDYVHYTFGIGALLEYAVYKGRTTNFNIGSGISFLVQKPYNGANETAFGFAIPFHLGVEHFFAKWFSMEFAIEPRLFSFMKQSDSWNFIFDLRSTALSGSFVFYLD